MKIFSKKLFAYGITSVVTSIVCAQIALAAISSPNVISPSVVGNWRVTFYLEPLRAVGASQCIVFTLVPGTVAGSPTSGTWTSPTFPGWSGQWIQQGDHVRWFGVTGGLVTTESGNMVNRNIFTGVSFNHFTASTATTSSAGSWVGVRAVSCTSGSSDIGTDPAGNASTTTEESEIK